MNWLYIALVNFIIATSCIVYAYTKKNYTRRSIWASLVFIPFILVNLAAPVRGWLDPEYAGYTFGLLYIPPGFLVTLVTGFIFGGCIASVMILIMNKSRKAHLFATVLLSGLIILFSIPSLIDIVTDFGGNAIVLGEYLRIGGAIVALIYTVLFILPPAYGMYYLVQKIKQVEESE